MNSVINGLKSTINILKNLFKALSSIIEFILYLCPYSPNTQYKNKYLLNLYYMSLYFLIYTIFFG